MAKRSPSPVLDWGLVKLLSAPSAEPASLAGSIVQDLAAVGGDVHPPGSSTGLKSRQGSVCGG